MKKLVIVLGILLCSFSADAAEDILQNISGKISEFAAGLIPGEGLTEVDVEFKGASEPTFTVLGVRDIQKNETSNYFTQFRNASSCIEPLCFARTPNHGRRPARFRWAGHG